MGLRERTEIDLQVVSLGWALMTLLVLAAARRYTSDWRERRRFRRHLATTQQRLAPASRTSPEASNAQEGTRWTRVVAAAPLVPLATAYVAVRVGWDVFEVVVFCLIDFGREAAGGLSACAYAGWQAACNAWRGLMLRRRAADFCVVLVESTVGWLFATAFPAVGRALESATRVMHLAAAWWVDFGGPALRDGIEFFVLDALVPAASFAARAAVAMRMRTQWLAVRIAEALVLVATDVWADVWALCQWMASDQRWWRDPRIRLALLRGIRWQREQLHYMWDLLADRMLPGIESFVVWTYAWVLRPLALLAVDTGDWLLQAMLESAVRLSAAALALGTTMVRLWTRLLRGCRWLQQRFGPGLVAAMVSLRHGLRRYAMLAADWCMQTVDISRAIYIRVHELVFVPVVCAVMSVGAAVWRRLAAADPYVRAALGQLAAHCRRLLHRLFEAVHPVSQYVEHMLLRVTSRVQQHLWRSVQAWGAAFMRWAYTSHSLLVPRIAQMGTAGLNRLHHELTRLWPVLQHAGREGAWAMADVYGQLAALVDRFVAIAGDLIVDYARRNAVHPQRPLRSNSHFETQPGSKEKSA
ncbi:hypothetical protein EV183_005635 [Coemansia sp. RSA 2336]|nr:hypothetical protein EV183_005635 [Coemansia sp. RSA 2336]